MTSTRSRRWSSRPAARRLDREELPQPGTAVPRPDPGGDARPRPRGREVRLPQGLQVLDLRDLVDPPGDRPRARRQGAHDPDPRPRRREAGQDRPRRAQAGHRARPRADPGGDRRGHRHRPRGGRPDQALRAGSRLAREAGRRRGGVGVRPVHRRREGRVAVRARRRPADQGSAPRGAREPLLPRAPRARARYGLGGEHPRTLDEVGRTFNVTRERIRQIENQSLKKLQSLAEAQSSRSRLRCAPGGASAHCRTSVYFGWLGIASMACSAAPSCSAVPLAHAVRAPAGVAVAVALIVTLLARFAGEEAKAGETTSLRPNIIVVMTDDQPPGMMRALPSVERLIGDRGATFTNAFVWYPLCCPSRATFLTGQYAHNHGTPGTTRRAAAAIRRCWSPGSTLASWLDAAGYETTFAGKWLNGLRTPKVGAAGVEQLVRPRRRGRRGPVLVLRLRRLHAGGRPATTVRPDATIKPTCSCATTRCR